MRSLVAFPILALAVILQSAIVSRISLLSGYADLVLLVVITWALQQGVTTAWHWAFVAGAMTAITTGLPLGIPLVVYLLAVFFAQVIQKRLWQAPLITVFIVTFLASLVSYMLSFLVLNFAGASLSFGEVFSLVMLPSMLLNLVFSIPVLWIMRDLARWVYPIEEED
jgi:rod shape-determining protein MreD